MLFVRSLVNVVIMVYIFVNLIFEVTKCICIKIRTRVLNGTISGELFCFGQTQPSLHEAKFELIHLFTNMSQRKTIYVT